MKNLVQFGATVASSQSFRRRYVVRVRGISSLTSSCAAPAQPSRRCCVVQKVINPVRLLRRLHPAHPKMLRCPGRRRLNPSEAFVQPLRSLIRYPIRPKTPRSPGRLGPSTLRLLLEVYLWSRSTMQIPAVQCSCCSVSTFLRFSFEHTTSTGGKVPFLSAFYSFSASTSLGRGRCSTPWCAPPQRVEDVKLQRMKHPSPSPSTASVVLSPLCVTP